MPAILLIGKILTQEIDIYRTAQLLINQHGDDASVEAKRRAEFFSERKDDLAEKLWIKVSDAVTWLQSNTSPSDTQCH